MDPGNWATDLPGRSAFGYTLLSVILLSNMMAMVLQSLSAKLGIVSGLDLAQVLMLQQRGFRKLEAFIVALLIIIAGCFAVELALSQPSIAAIAGGLVPRPEIVTNPAMLYIAIGILGATVMPYNLYLHSSIVQTRRFD